MATEVILTGTGIPHPTPGRAGPGTLVRSGSVALQFDAGRGTVLRLADAGVRPHELAALFLTHVHSDHVVDVADVAMTRWLEDQVAGCGPLPIVTATGSTEPFLAGLFTPFAEDIRLRIAHVQEHPPEIAVSTFDASGVARPVWSSADRTVTVSAVAVHHEPVDAVAYRVDTPDGAVVVSGDTRVCDEVASVCSGAAVVVHEACRARAMARVVAGTLFEQVMAYHADTVALGTMAEAAGVPHLVLTHLIPSPATPAEAAGFVDDVRAGGYTGRVSVGDDLLRVAVGG